MQLTNVAVVRYVVKKRKKKMRFEIACYKNKVVNYREGVETAMDEVLQIDTIFTNVQRGIVANQADLTAAFGTTELMDICRVILTRGCLQVSSGERKVLMATMFKEVATIIADKCVNPASDRPYPVNVIERAMKQAHVAIDPAQSAKKQALHSISKLAKCLPIKRALMAVEASVAAAQADALVEGLAALGDQCRIVRRSEGALRKSFGVEDDAPSQRVLCHIDPAKYRYFDTLVQRLNDGEGGGVEIIEQCVHASGGGGGGGGGDTALSAPVARVLRRDAAAAPLRDLSASATALPPTPPAPPAAGSKACRTCGGSFTIADYRGHFKSDWHRTNMQRKIMTPPLPPLTEAEFNALPPSEVKT